MIDICRVDSYILFQEFRKQNPDIKELRRPKSFSQLDFTDELIRQLGNIDNLEDIPSRKKPKQFTKHSIIPIQSKSRKNCKLCYSLHKIEQKCPVSCQECETWLCFTANRNCLLKYHQCSYFLLTVKQSHVSTL